MKTFNQATRQEVQALERMKSPELRPLLELLASLLEDTKNALIRAEGDTVYRLQGRAGVLQEFVEAVENAARTNERMQ